MLDVRRLRLLRELALRGTIAAVAEALAFTPSAVSQQLSALEREAGVPLLERTGRRVTLTPAGRRLVPHAEAVLERLELAAAELVDARQGLAGPLRIGTFPTAARAILPAALVALATRHPRLEPMLSEVDPAAVADALRAGELDVALVHDYDFVPSLTEPGLATEPLCAEAMYLAWITTDGTPDVRGTDGAPARGGAPATAASGAGPVPAARAGDAVSTTVDSPVASGVSATTATRPPTTAPATSAPRGGARQGSVPSGVRPGTPSHIHAPSGLAVLPGSVAPVGGDAVGPGLAHWRDATWITATPGTLCHTMTMRACQAAGFAPRVRHQVDEFATVLALVAAGQGVALVPQLGLVNPPPQVALTPMAMSRRTKIAFRSGAGRHPAVAAVAAALRAVVADDALGDGGGVSGPVVTDGTGRPGRA
ncbi:LysR family transcriptional regulator [Streptomyces sp. NPDC057702]|uniref:LysR family transcriptional regulator n=1 Tax=unclassified Streptomyces TaxID=2593676 RepID=UPI0036CE0590